MSYGKADPPSSSAKPHLAIRNPSEWIIRFAPLVREGGPVLDLAAGGGRHGRYFLERGHPVTLVDRQTEAMLDLNLIHERPSSRPIWKTDHPGRSMRNSLGWWWSTTSIDR